MSSGFFDKKWKVWQNKKDRTHISYYLLIMPGPENPTPVEAPKPTPVETNPEAPASLPNANDTAAGINSQRNAQKIRENIEKNNGEAKYEFAFECVNSDIVKLAQVYIAETVDKTLE